jgi:hypothetical protein
VRHPAARSRRWCVVPRRLVEHGRNRVVVDDEGTVVAVAELQAEEVEVGRLRADGGEFPDQVVCVGDTRVEAELQRHLEGTVGARQSILGETVMATNIGLAFIICLFLFAVLVAGLWAYSRLRRRRPAT